MLLRRSHQRLRARAGGVAALCIKSCSCAILHRSLADAPPHPHPHPPPERTRRRPLSGGSRSPPKEDIADETLSGDGNDDHGDGNGGGGGGGDDGGGERPYLASTRQGVRLFPRKPLLTPIGVPSVGVEHGAAAAARQRYRGESFVESALPPRGGTGVAMAAVAEAVEQGGTEEEAVAGRGAGAGAGVGEGADVVAVLRLEAVEGAGVAVAAAGVTVDSSAEDSIYPLGPIDPLGGREEELGESASGGSGGSAKLWDEDGLEVDKGDHGGEGVGGKYGGGGGVNKDGALSDEDGAVGGPDDSEDGVSTPSPAGERAPRIGEERAHKMWVTMGGGATVLEHEWEAYGAAGAGAGAGAGKDDTAVIQFYSKEKDDDQRFQGFGVVKEDKAEDIRTLVESFTAPALAAALRDRETALHECAHRLQKGDWSGVERALLPFTAKQIAISRRALRRLDLDPEGFTKTHMYTLIKVLQRLPRHVTALTEQRVSVMIPLCNVGVASMLFTKRDFYDAPLTESASVMIPLCNVDGVASVLFTKRSGSLRAHKNEICFPGGKVDIGVDQHIVQTALREMGEEIGILECSVDVLGVLRCDWAEVASLIGVAVTPVVGFLGNLSREQINPNPDEVSHCFTIPIRYLLQEDRWRTEKYKAPAFVGGPYVIWGLTGYILHRLVHDVLRKHLVIV